MALPGRHLLADHNLAAPHAGLRGRLEGAVDGVVVGDGDDGEAEPDSLRHDARGRCLPIASGRVDVQIGNAGPQRGHHGVKFSPWAQGLGRAACRSRPLHRADRSLLGGDFDRHGRWNP